MTRKQKWILGLAALAAFMTALDALVVTTALSTIRRDLSASVAQLEWTVNAYNLSFAVLLMTAAALGDRFGRRRMFVGGIALFSVSSAACAVAPSIGALIAARAVQGAGAALVTTLALALVGVAFPPERRGSALGVFFAVNGLAVAGGPLVGGALTQGIDWEWIFWLNVPIGIALIPLVLARVPESRGPAAALDLRGLALVTGGVLGVVWALVRGNAAGWASLEVVGTALGGLLLLGAFVAWELRARAPMLPMQFFRLRAFSAGNAAIFWAIGGLFCSAFFIAQFLQTGLGFSPLAAGLRMLPWTATLFFVAPVAGKLVDRYGERPFLVLGPALQALGMGWIGLVASSSMSYGELIPPLIVAGVGISMTFPAAQNSVVSSVPAAAIGKAAGTNSTMRELGGVLGIAVGVAAFAGAGNYASPVGFTDGFVAAMGVSAALSVLAAMAGSLLPSRAGLRAAVAEAAVTEASA
jgi:EmrB/QacA subfamily drug resistance transporter